MKTNNLCLWRLALACVFVLLNDTTFAQTWQTVDDYLYLPLPGRQMWARSGAVDAVGRLYVAGSGTDDTGTGSGVGHGIIRRSDNQGASWTILEDYIHNDTNRFTYLQGSGFDSAQKLYAVGYAQYLDTNQASGSFSSLFVRESADSGVTWGTVLDLKFPGWNALSVGPGTPGLATDSAGGVYVFVDVVNTGTSVFKSSNGGANWTTLHPFTDATYARGMVATPAGLFVIGGSVLRKSVNGGATWATVDAGFTQTAIYADPQGNLYTGGGANVTTGSGKKAVTTYQWIIRKSTNGGVTWKTTGAFSLNGYSSGPYLSALISDAAGNMYAAGALTPANGSGAHWIVTQSPDRGTSWYLSDDFQYVIGSTALPWFLASDAAGGVYSGGMAIGGGTQRWVVRRHFAQ